jgi:hypothetical protein
MFFEWLIDSHVARHRFRETYRPSFLWLGACCYPANLASQPQTLW